MDKHLYFKPEFILMGNNKFYSSISEFFLPFKVYLNHDSILENTLTIDNQFL